MSSTPGFDPYLDWLGIPGHDRPIDHYRLLGLPHFESDTRRITQHADQRMALVRSFQSGARGEWTHRILNELSQARRCLTYRETKTTYDAALRGILEAGPIEIIESSTAPPSLGRTESGSPRRSR